MRSVIWLTASTAMIVTAVPLHAGGVRLQNAAFKEVTEAGIDGTRKTALVGVGTTLPGNIVVFQMRYLNDGPKAAERLVIANAVPNGMTYAGPALGTPEPAVSVDAGHNWGPLTTLRVGAAVASRQAREADVTNVRWMIAGPVAAGASGVVAYRALVK